MCGNCVYKSLADYTVIDLETTGFSPGQDKIIEVSATRVRNHQAVSSFSELINPKCSVRKRITDLTGITDEMFANARLIQDVLPEYLAFVGSDIIVGHNVRFDLSFLECSAADLELFALETDYVDTLYMSRSFHPDLPHHRLSDMVDYFHIEVDIAHRALTDCKSTFLVYESLLNEWKLDPTIIKRKRERTHHERNETDSSLQPEGYPEWEKAEELRKAGELDAALSMLDAAKIKGYDAPVLYESYAMIYRRNKDYRREIEALDEAMTMQWNGAMRQRLQERRQKATQLLEKALYEQKVAAERKRLREERQRARQEKKDAKQSSLKEPGKPAGRAIFQMTEDMTVIRRYESIAEAVRESGVNSKSVRDAANGVQKRAGGFVWRYEDQWQPPNKK